MESLSHLVGAFPASSQSAGNTTSDSSTAMTAPGSASEGAPPPQSWMGMDIPAVREPTVIHPAGEPPPHPWTLTTGRPWAEATPDESGGHAAPGPWTQK